MSQTWDEAAAEAAKRIDLANGWAMARGSLSREKALKHVINNVEAAIEGWPTIKTNDVPSYLGSAARAAISYLAGVLVAEDECGDVRSAHREVLDRIIPMVIDRQRKYGTENILKFGQSGIAMRVHDKKARLAEGSMDFDDEKELDAWEDIIGYAIISEMLESGTFELPLASADAVDDPAEAGSPTAHLELEARVGELEKKLMLIEARTRPYISWDTL